MKNLKSKDYLGKARLIASSDKANMGTGFAGTDRGAVITQDLSKDDRPAESISYAASNLVRTDLTSRYQRQQSEPPMNRGAFPPTPPPESDGQRPGLQKSSTFSPTGGKPPGMTTRANSIRDGTGAGPRMNSRRVPREGPIDEDRLSPGGRRDYQDLESPGAYPAPLRAGDNVMDRPRFGSQRAASESRNPTSKYSTARPGRGQRDDRGRLFMETTPRRQMSGDDVDDEYPDELYDLYQSTAYSNPYTSNNSSRRNTQQRRQPTYSDLDRDSGGSSLDDFEMLNDAGGSLSNRNMSRTASRSRPVDIRTVRVKMHHGDDTRYLMVSTGIMWDEFLGRAQEKLAIRGGFKIRMKDEGDMITVGDGDDWDMALQTSKREARKGGEEMARLEVSSYSLTDRMKVKANDEQVWVQDG